MGRSARAFATAPAASRPICAASSVSAPAEVEAYRAKHLVADIVALIEQPGGAPLERWSRTTGAARWPGNWRRSGRVLERLVIINSPHPATFLRELQR